MSCPSVSFRCSFLAALIVAAPALAQTGKCCLPDGRGCRDVTQAQCDAFGGMFLAGQTCSSPDDTCDTPLTGACCTPGGCATTLNTQCNVQGAVFHPNTPCTPSPCGTPTTGACCENFQCRITIAVDCPLGTFFANQGCTAGLCGTPPTGACCRGGTCTVTLQTDCFNSGLGAEWFQSQPCATNFCRLGACCSGPRSCVIVTQSGCEQGVWTADGTCVAMFCISVIGACCRDTGQCVVTADFDCENGTFSQGNPCIAVTCEAAIGACCHGTTCSTATQISCGAGGGAYQGSGTACGAAGNPTSCCPANFNGVGGVSVQDIFDFLAAYFANDPRADFNHSGAVSVQDIFDFLAAYFAGCP
jgi:hypothetical protein